MGKSKRNISERANKLYKENIIIDGLSSAVVDEVYAQRMVNSGLTAVKISLATTECLKDTVKTAASWFKKIERLSNYLIYVTNLTDIEKAKNEGKVGIIFGFQGANPIEDNINFVNIFHKIGIRVMGLNYNERNLLGDGCAESTNVGLSSFGISVIKEINKVGILLDLSHVGEQTTLEAIEESTKPMVISCSNVRNLVDNPRNVSDKILKALAKKDGVIGVISFPAFVTKKTNPSIDDFIDHIDYIVNLIGVDHVGIGLDLCEGITKEAHTIETGEIGYNNRPFPPSIYPPWPWIFPEGISKVEDFPNIAQGLLDRGYKERDIVKILGENFLRVYKEVW